jgi:Flp pilus assembly protein TadB
MNLFAFFSRQGEVFRYPGTAGPSHENSHIYISDSGYGSFRNRGAFWLFSVCAGLLLVFFSVLLIIYPELLAFFFAGIMMFTGLFFISTGLFLRSLRNRKQGSVDF